MIPYYRVCDCGCAIFLSDYEGDPDVTKKLYIT